MQNIIFLVTFFSITFPILSLITPGGTNPFYSIEAYYGSRDKEFFSVSAYLNDAPTTFYWHTYFDDDGDRFYFTDPSRHAIFYKNHSSNYYEILSGIPGYSGYRDGELVNSLFYSPNSIQLFVYDSVEAQKEREKFAIILNSLSSECLYSTYGNYSGCVDWTHKDTDSVDKSYVKFIYPPFSSSKLTTTDIKFTSLSKNVMFALDSKNNCIRQINLKTRLSTTYAGQCGTQGFKDGPYGVNLFNNPTSFGINAVGELYVLDSGNNYIRKVKTDQTVQTLLQGACRSNIFGESKTVLSNFKYNSVTCYSNWIKTSGLPDAHIWTELTALEACFNQTLLCNSGSSTHPLIAHNSTFN